MERRPRKNSGNGMNYNLYITLGIIILAAVVFVVTYTLYGNKLNKHAELRNVEKIAGTQNKMLNTIENTESSQVSSSIGKSVNEATNSATTNTENTEVEKRAVNTSKTEEAVKSENKTTTKNEEKNSSENSEDKKNNDEQNAVTPSFAKPVDGDVVKNYASDNLLYSNTLDEWTVHLGIDYAAEKTSIVKAAADGTVKSIKNDPRYGLTVVIEHSNGFTSMYANLLSTEFISVGEKVTKGQTIATVGNTATFEIADETHLHFEILKDGVNVDPNLYIK